MEDKLMEKTCELIDQILDEGINTNNLDPLYKLTKINHIAKEDKDMNYGNYGRDNYGEYNRGNYNGYGNYGEYNRRGYGARGRYRGHEHLDRIYDDYGRYSESRERYGANEDTKRSLKYMLDSMEDFARMLKEEAQSQEEVDMIRQTAQKIAQM